MTFLNLSYRTDSALEEEIYSHLQVCDADFYPPLCEKVDIREYSSKIYNNSVTFEAWAGNKLVGLLAAYLNDLKSRLGYITNVSVVRDYVGRGIASELINRCIRYSQDNGFNEIKLEVHEKNAPAILLYAKKGFIKIENEGDMVLMRLVVKKV